MQLLCLGVCLAQPGKAHASVALLLEQPYGGLTNVFNPTGHSAIYLDHVCAETPVQLRPCRPGELGVVISRYDGIHGYDWVAVPLIPYLYSVERTADIPTFVDRTVEVRLRNDYRRSHLESVAPDGPGDQPSPGNWYELVGSAFDRTIYGFQVETTTEQDTSLIAMLNDRPNVEHYNGAFRNCADFARVMINYFYPHAVRRNFIGDLGLTTPKSVARGLTYYAQKHPEAGLRVFVVPQVNGYLPRSHSAQGVTESLLKRYALPIFALSPTTAAVVLAAYIEHGRFDMPRNAPRLDIAALQSAADHQAPATAPALGEPSGGAGFMRLSLPGDSLEQPVIPAFLEIGVAEPMSLRYRAIP
jgi:hypothetical protein